MVPHVKPCGGTPRRTGEPGSPLASATGRPVQGCGSLCEVRMVGGPGFRREAPLVLCPYCDRPEA